MMPSIVFAGGLLLGRGGLFQAAARSRRAQAGYANGHKGNPTYQEVCAHMNGHAKDCRIECDESRTDLTRFLASVAESRGSEPAEYPAPTAAEIEPLGRFYSVEEYHQDYQDKNPSDSCRTPFELLRPWLKV